LVSVDHAEAHQADHNSGGADALKLDDLAAPDDNTDLGVSTSAHGLVLRGTGVGDFLKDDGSWAAGGGNPQATQAAIEAETNENTYLPPDLIKYSPGVSKAWCKGSYSAGTPQADASYNISSMGDDGTGHMQFNFTNNFSSATFASVLTPTSGTPGRTCSTNSGAVGSVDG
jgi:hypothetical protein